MRKRKYILVLSGGGAKGAFQVGALKYLFKNGFYHGDEHIPGKKVRFDYIAGISAGSLNAVMVAMQQFPELERLWVNEIAGNPERIWTSDFVTGDLKLKDGALEKLLPEMGFWKKVGLLWKKNRKKLEQVVLENIMSLDAFASNRPLQERLEQLVDVSKISIDTSLRVGYVSLDSGKYHSVKHSNFKSNKAFTDAILASANMPIIWPPVAAINLESEDGKVVKHTNLVDGGIRNVSPLGDIVNDVSDNYEPNTDYYVIIINNHNGTLTPVTKKNGKRNFLEIAHRSLVDITLNEIFVNDIREFTRINRLVHQVEEAAKARAIPDDFEFVNPSDQRVFRKFYYKIVQPEGFIGTTLDFSKEQINTRIEHGYSVAKKIFGEEEIPLSSEFPSVERDVATSFSGHSFRVDEDTEVAELTTPPWHV